MLSLLVALSASAFVQEGPYRPFQACLAREATARGAVQFVAALDTLCTDEATQLRQALVATMRAQGATSDQATQFATQEIMRLRAEAVSAARQQ